MDNKKLGMIILGLTIVTSLLIYGFMTNLRTQTTTLGCYPTKECQRAESMLNLSHIAVGLISFFAALGFYLLFFTGSDEAILARIEAEKNARVSNDKFSILLSAMDPAEQQVIKVIKEQDGITQSTLKYRADMSKAKLSLVLSSFERKGLIKRIEKGKTYEIHLAQNI